MSDKPPQPCVIEANIRELSQNSSNVAWGQHVRERMAERGFNTRMLFDTLQMGFQEGTIEEQDEPNSWKTIMTRRIPVTGRYMGAVTVVINNEKLFIKTVEWMDL